MKNAAPRTRAWPAPSTQDERDSRRPTMPAPEATEASSGIRVPRARPLLARVPMVALEGQDLVRRSLDHRSGFLLAQIDGTSNVETLLDLCPFPQEEALQLLDGLVASGVVVLL